MAQDDMHVVMYRILAYLYACMKEGTKPERRKYDAEHMEINKPYWSSIMAEMARRNLVAGITATTTADGDFIHIGNVRITMEGVEFLMENSMMAKAKTFLMDIKAAVPFV